MGEIIFVTSNMKRKRKRRAVHEAEGQQDKVWIIHSSTFVSEHPSVSTCVWVKISEFLIYVSWFPKILSLETTTNLSRCQTLWIVSLVEWMMKSVHHIDPVLYNIQKWWSHMELHLLSLQLKSGSFQHLKNIQVWSLKYQLYFEWDV